ARRCRTADVAGSPGTRAPRTARARRRPRRYPPMPSRPVTIRARGRPASVPGTGARTPAGAPSLAPPPQIESTTRDMSWGDSSTLGDRTEHGLHVDDGGTVDRLEARDPDPQPVDRQHPHPVQPDRVRPVRRTGAEHAGLRPAHVTARVDHQYPPVGL